MNVGELKELIKDLPDDTRVIEAHDGPMVFSVTPLSIDVENMYYWPDNSALESDGKLWIEPLEDKTIKETVLCVRTY